MARRVLGVLLLGAGALCVPTAQGQTAPVAVVPGSESAHAFFTAPGNYGMSVGYPSYGSVRTYSEFSSPYGPGYAYGYRPNAFLPGRFGVGLWRPEHVSAPLENVGYQSYRTFPVPYVRGVPAVTPGVGLYAPAFGPP